MLILASTSRYRRAQLEQLGLEFEQRAPGVDEAAIQAEGWPPEVLALKLAEAKARAVAEREDGVVIGGDQLVAFEGEVLGKPGSVEAAVTQLARLQGRTHCLLTAICVASRDSEGGGLGIETHLARTELRLRPLSVEALRRYVERDQPLDCAGSYKFEVGGAVLFDRVQTEDPSAFSGLPVLGLVRLLARFGIEVP